MTAIEVYSGYKKPNTYCTGGISVSGPSAVGKSTVSALLAEALSYSHFDLDDETAERAGYVTSGEVIRELGHEQFKTIQSNCLRDIVMSESNFVLAAGGEIWRPGYDRSLIEQNRSYLRDKTFNICLLPSMDVGKIVNVLYPRLNDGKRDTRTKGRDEFGYYVALGLEQYCALADAVVLVGDAGVEDVKSFILKEVLTR